MRLSGQWEFPGGKREAGESGPEALVREINEELGINIAVGDWLGQGHAVLPDGRRVELDVYACTWRTGEIQLTEHDAIQWCGPATLADRTWAEADVPVLSSVLERLGAVDER